MATFTPITFTDGEIPTSTPFNNNFSGITDQMNGNLDNTNIANPLLMDAGAVGAPTYSFSGDGDTGMFHEAANTLNLATAGAMAITIDSSQNVSLEATKKLYLDGGGDTYLLESSANQADIYVGGNLALRIQTTLLDIYPGGASGIRVDNNSTAGNTRLNVYDVDNAQFERVSVGAADSGGAGYKVLRIAN